MFDLALTLAVSSILLLAGGAVLMHLPWTDEELKAVDEEAKAVFDRLTRWER